MADISQTFPRGGGWGVGGMLPDRKESVLQVNFTVPKSFPPQQKILYETTKNLMPQ